MGSQGDQVDTKLELNRYKSIPQEVDEAADPLNWWRTHSASYPHLSKLTRQYLGIPATSVPVERLFSEAGELISAKRNSLKPENANMLLCLNSSFQAPKVFAFIVILQILQFLASYYCSEPGE